MGTGKGGGTGQGASQGQAGGGTSSGTGTAQAQGSNIQYGVGASAGYYGDRGGGAAGDSSGGQSQGQGGAGGAGAGYGEAGTVSFCYEVYSGSDALIAESGYTYSNREDARDAGMKLAKYPGYVIVKPDKAGFNSSRYDAVPGTEPGVVVTVGEGGETIYTGQGDKPVTGPGGASGGDSGGLPGLDNNWMMYLVIAIIIIAIIAFGLKGGS